MSSQPFASCSMLSALLPYTKYHTPFTQKFQGNPNATDIFMPGKMITTTPSTFRYSSNFFETDFNQTKY